MGGSLAPVRMAGFTWNGWQPSAVYAHVRSSIESNGQGIKTKYLDQRAIKRMERAAESEESTD